MKPFAFLIVCVALIFFSSCRKNDLPGDESILYGTWIKGTNTGDTLVFTKKDGKNLIRYNQSFNPGLSAPTESEYTYQNGKLAMKGYLSAGTSFFFINSFSWKQVGKEFEIEGSTLFPFMAATLLLFTYRKI